MSERGSGIGKENKNNPLPLTPYQLNRILQFSSDKSQTSPFSAFGEFLNKQEKEELAEAVSSPELSLPPAGLNDVLPNLLSPNLNNQALLKKITSSCQLHLISESDWETLNTPDNWDKLPLPVVLTWATLGKGLRNQVEEFLAKGGVIAIFFFKKAPNFYLEAIENLPDNLSFIQKIALVLAGKVEGLDLTHQFITVGFIPKEEIEEKNEVGNPYHLRMIVNQKLDKNYEKKYGEIILLSSLVKGHMDEVKISVMAMSGLAGVFYLIDQIAQGKMSPELYLAFQGLVKIITHLFANLADFYSQYKLFLKGENEIDQIKDLIGYKLGWREAAVFLNGMLIDVLSEVGGDLNRLLGSAVFGAEPMIGTALTTLAGSYRMNHSSFWERVRIMAENPAVLGRNTAAFLTFLTSVGLLGLADMFHNPVAVGLVGGLTEPILAILATEFSTRLKIGMMKNRLIEEAKRKKRNR